MTLSGVIRDKWVAVFMRRAGSFQSCTPTALDAESPGGELHAALDGMAGCVDTALVILYLFGCKRRSFRLSSWYLLSLLRIFESNTEEVGLSFSPVILAEGEILGFPSFRWLLLVSLFILLFKALLHIQYQRNKKCLSKCRSVGFAAVPALC